MSKRKTPNYPSPCIKCAHNKNCTRYRVCQPWLTRYLYRQKQINAYAKNLKEDIEE